ncbi:hypothetical protein NPIL_284451 [Nephila pilipes]|uniref:Uncharacterized protein n=1 Tax=Nephila pilipes TaxID=299642 RepID=A0A8X6Q2U0_NEPPI|nr:hypothetical protein NPIL_284451 [Nephila pilipes]
MASFPQKCGGKKSRQQVEISSNLLNTRCRCSVIRTVSYIEMDHILNNTVSMHCRPFENQLALSADHGNSFLSRRISSTEPELDMPVE